MPLARMADDTRAHRSRPALSSSGSRMRSCPLYRLKRLLATEERSTPAHWWSNRRNAEGRHARRRVLAASRLPNRHLHRVAVAGEVALKVVCRLEVLSAGAGPFAALLTRGAAFVRLLLDRVQWEVFRALARCAFLPANLSDHQVGGRTTSSIGTLFRRRSSNGQSIVRSVGGMSSSRPPSRSPCRHRSSERGSTPSNAVKPRRPADQSSRRPSRRQASQEGHLAEEGVQALDENDTVRRLQLALLEELTNAVTSGGKLVRRRRAPRTF